MTRWRPSIARLSSGCLLFNDWLLITAWTYAYQHPRVGYINVNLCATRTHHIATKPRSVSHFLCYSLQWICHERLFTSLGMNARTCSHNTLPPSFITHTNTHSYESRYGVLTDSNQMVFSMSIQHCRLLPHRMPHWRDPAEMLSAGERHAYSGAEGVFLCTPGLALPFSIAWSSTQKSPEAFPTA